MVKPGFVYALINPSMPGLVKVGRTERDPTVRVSELSGVTGVAPPCILVFHQAFEDCELAERHAHAVLEREGRRFAANREFFETQPTTAIHAILAAPGATTQVPQTVNRELVKPQASLLKEILDRASGYMSGNGEQPKDVKEGIKLYLKAGKLGSPEAYLKLGDIYFGDHYIKRNDSKAFEYYRMSCEMNYAPAWAKVAILRREGSGPIGEALAWRRFFELALAQESQDETLIYNGASFLDPRPSLELTYFPCSAKIGDEHIETAVEFIRPHAELIEKMLLRQIEDIKIDKYGLYEFGIYKDIRFGDTRSARIEDLEEVRKWVSEL
jgi:hypothetical protein